MRIYKYLCWLCLFVMSGCACDGSSTSNGERAQLTTELAHRRLSLVTGQPQIPATADFLIFNAGGVDAAILDMQISGDQRGHFKLLTSLSLPLTLSSGRDRGMRLRVQYHPRGLDLSVARLDIVWRTLGSSREEKLSIELNGRLKASALRLGCSDGLDFGEVRLGQKKTLSCELENRGDGPATISGLIYQPKQGGRGEFALRSPGLPLRLEAGAKTSLFVVYAPQDDGDFHDVGSLALEGDGLVAAGGPPLRIDVVGRTWRDPSWLPCLRSTPEELNFGPVGPSCDGAKKTLTLRNAGGPGCGGVRISELVIRVEAGFPKGAFHILKGPSSEKILKPGEEAEISIRFKPELKATYQAKLRVETSQGVSAGLDISLLGVGEETQQWVIDRFRQRPKPRMDALFVIDNSPSMREEQDSLAKNFNAYINWVIRLNVDYRIMVVTTDISGKSYPPGCARGRVKVITPSTPNPVQVFLENTKVGVSGSRTEQGLEAARLALSPERLNDPLCNQGFWRVDAKAPAEPAYRFAQQGLNLIFVSDEDDQSPHPVGWYTRWFRSLVGWRHAGWLRASSIVGTPWREASSMGCRHVGVANASSGTRYAELTQQLKGISDLICNPNWASTLSNIGSGSSGNVTEFYLSQSPVVETLAVEVDGIPIKKDALRGWQYDKALNCIRFAWGGKPALGASIRVSYQPVCLQ